jgi:hypothetical protein
MVHISSDYPLGALRRRISLCYGAYFCYRAPGQKVNGGRQHTVPGSGRKSDLIIISRAIPLDLRTRVWRREVRLPGRLSLAVGPLLSGRSSWPA